MKKIRESKITRKIFLIMLLVSLSAVTTLAFIQAYSNYKDGQINAISHQREILNTIVGELKDHLFLIQKLLELSSHSRGVLEEGINEKFRFDLWKIMKHNSSIFEVVAIDKNGKELLVASKIRTENVLDYQDVSGEDYFQKAILENVYYSDIKYHFHDTKPYFIISVPVYKFDKTITAVLASKIWFSVIQENLSRKKFSKTGYAFILDVNKRVIAHPNLDIVFGNRLVGDISKKLEETIDRAIENPNNYFQVSYVDFDNTPVFATIKYIKELNWIVVVAQKRSEVYSSVLKAIFSFLFISGIVVILVFFVGKKLSEHFSLPIVKLKDLTERISDGDFSTKIDIKTNDEIEDLANNFNEMKDKLRNSYAEMENKIQERTKELLLLYSFTSAISRSLRVHETLKSAGDELVTVLELEGYASVFYKDGIWDIDNAVYGFIINEKSLKVVWDEIVKRGIVLHLLSHHVPYISQEKIVISNLNNKIKSFALFPILYQGNLVGVMILFSSSENFFQSGIVSSIETCMIQLGVAIANAERYEYTENLSFKDPLTKLFNRRYFETKLEQEFAKCERYNREVSLCMIDIDFFKKINDTYGHQAGDEILKQLAQIILKTIRKCDIAGRYGGEEFIVLMPETPPKNAYIALERLRKTVEEHAFVIDVPPGYLHITVSIGLAGYVQSMTKKEELIELADKALYTAKNSGRNKVCL